MELELIYSKLLEIQVNLRKLGPIKRDKYRELVCNKISLADEYFKDYETIVKSYEQKSAELLSGYILELIVEKIESVYAKIKSYYKCELSKITESKMDKFDLKTATSLVIVMDGKEETTEKVIDGIEMYSTYLKDAESKKLLIDFVLKTRLTKSAKLKLNSSYNTCADLIKHMKERLLTRKSANSLLSQLNSISQKDMTISEYATKIEQLFVDLTISQAGTNSSAFEILRPINENLAIKRFADGLRNRRLSTIISARDYADLKDAARAAEDEELSQPSSSNVVLNIRGKSNRGYRPQRGQSNYRGHSYRGHFNNTRAYRGNNAYPQRNYNTYPNQNRGYSRGFSSRPNRFNNHYPRGNHQRSAFTAQQQPGVNTSTPEAGTSTDRSQFFRQ